MGNQQVVIMKINLRKLLTEDKSNLPDWVDYENCIYRIENLITHKCYVGQARWFYGRFLANPDWMTHIGAIRSGSSHIANSIRKHKSRNFIVHIIEHDLPNREVMNDRECYWISFYNSYEDGYNSDKGGHDMTPCHTEESIRKKIETDKARHGGKLGLNSEESIRKSHETLRKKYGSSFGAINNPETYKRLKEERGGDYMKYCHTPEAIKKSMESQRRNHQGRLAFNTEDSISNSIRTRVERYGTANHICGSPEIRRKAVNTEIDRYGALRMSMPDLHAKSTLTQSFNSINRYLSELTDPTATDYLNHAGKRHVSRMLSRLDQLRSDPRWTPMMESIFSKLASDQCE